MKTLIIYSSQTGFTKQYSEWIAQDTGATLLPIKEAKKKELSFFNEYDTIVYGGWIMGANLIDKEWFAGKVSAIKESFGTNKKFAAFVVGGSPVYSPDIPGVLDRAVPNDLKSDVATFYFQGGLNYGKMNFMSRMIMKAFAKGLGKKPDLSDADKEMAKLLQGDFDHTDRNYIKAIVEYINS